MISGKRIVLGICGSIAAYKAAFLTRLLIKAGAQVKIIMTPGAREFVGGITLSALSKNPVYCELVDQPGDIWVNHVEIGLWANALVIAPATANTLSKLAHGACDNLLCAVYLSARCPIFLAPAMDFDMLLHPATRHNFELLKSYGNHIIRPGTGELASGLSGEGRLADPEVILETLTKHFSGLE